VEYRQQYLGFSDHFAYSSPCDPPQPHSLSETGYRSQFASRAAVDAAGGPEAYAVEYAEELLAEREGLGTKKPPRRREKRAEGSHVARVEEDKKAESDRKFVQRELF
jgi:hypothetical protein